MTDERELTGSEIAAEAFAAFGAWVAEQPEEVRDLDWYELALLYGAAGDD